MIDFDFNDDLNAAKAAEVRKQAHIANGGEATFDCPKCRGSGMTPWGRCFKCNGNGTVSRGVIAAAKGKVTKANNIAQWKADHADVIEYLDKRSGRWPFAASMREKIEEWGKLTENQLAVVRKVMAQDAEKAEAKKAERANAAPVVEISAIEKLFATATNNDIKRPIFRAEGIEISLASPTGKNPGALYVKAGGEYAGKIVGGKFHKVASAPADVTERLMAVAVDPAGEAIKYGRKTGSCGCCGRELVDPVSIRSGIGPICAEKWGLEFRRDAAREELEGEA